MASAAEQLASSLNFGTLAKATELRKRIWFTLLALIVYRFGTYVPVPGVDAAVMGEMLNRHGGGILGMFDMFTGGALGRMTVFALNLMPYISASIIVQLMSSAIPTLEALKKEGESGRKKMNQYTRYLTVLIAMFQSFGISVGLEGMHGNNGAAAVIDPGLFFRVSCVITLVGGTMFLMWLGEQITARGIGNGTSLIIFSGIVANLPHALGNMLEMGRTGGLSPVFIVGFLVVGAGGDRVHRVHGAGAAASGDPVSETPGGDAHVRWGRDPYAAEDEHQRRDSADFRQLDPAGAGDHRGVFQRVEPAGVDAAVGVEPDYRDYQPAGTWPAAVHGVVRGHDHLLQLFLHRGRVQPDRRRRTI